jgi:hypothetical protein
VERKIGDPAARHRHACHDATGKQAPGFLTE